MGGCSESFQRRVLVDAVPVTESRPSQRPSFSEGQLQSGVQVRKSCTTTVLCLKVSDEQALPSNN